MARFEGPQFGLKLLEAIGIDDMKNVTHVKVLATVDDLVRVEVGYLLTEDKGSRILFTAERYTFKPVPNDPDWDMEADRR